MERNRLYYQMPYVKEFQASVLSCKKNEKGLYEVILSQTAFYPEGGGQPYDTGVLGGRKVTAVYEKENQVIHYTDGALEEGSLVTGVIDWELRYEYMQHHSGEHIYSGLVHRHWGYDNVGFHMGKDEVTIDFNGPLTWEQALEIEKETNRLIYDNLPVIETYPSPEELKELPYRSKKELTGDVRIIEIPGGDICACCGTHVERTGEIGILKITGLMNYKGGVRLFLLCGQKARLDYEDRLQKTVSISRLLSAKPEKIVEAVEKMKAENNEKTMMIHNLHHQIFEMKTESLPNSENRLIIWENHMNPVYLRQFCTMLYEKGKGSVVLVLSPHEKEEGVWQYALGSSQTDMRSFSKGMNQALSGKGGGSALMVQGTLKAEKEAVEQIFFSLEV